MAPAQTEETLSGIARDIADDVRRLVKAEMELAKAEAFAAGKRAALGAALGVVAASFLFIALFFVLGGLATWLGTVVFTVWAWWFIFFGVFLVVTAAFGLLAFRQMKRTATAVKELQGSMREDATWLQQLTKRNANEN